MAFAAGLSASDQPAERARIRCVVEMSGGMPEPYRSQATSQFPPTFLAHGALDDVVSVDYAVELERRLAELGVPHEQHILANEGHWFSDAGQMQLLLAAGEFLHRHLQPTP